MVTFGRLFAASLTLLAVAPTDQAFAQASYPDKPITLVVNYPAGGGSDAIGRALARALEKIFNQPVPVDNIAGGNATRGVTAVVTAAPDGYKIGVATNSPMTIAAQTVGGLPWNTPDSYDIVGGIASMYNVVCAQPDAPFSTVQELVAYAKRNPNKLKVSSIAGGLNQYTWNRFVRAADVKIRFVPYSGDADGIASFLGGNTELVNLTWPGLKPHLEAGKAKCLALFAPERVSSHPALPTFKESAFDVTTTSDYVVYAPKGMPAATRRTLASAVEAATKDADLVRVLSGQNIVVKHTDGAEMTERFKAIYKDIGEFLGQKSN